MKKENLEDGFVRLTAKKGYYLLNEEIGLSGHSVVLPEDSDFSLWKEKKDSSVTLEGEELETFLKQEKERQLEEENKQRELAKEAYLKLVEETKEKINTKTEDNV